MSDTTISLTPLIYNYLKKTSLREECILKDLREETKKIYTTSMLISAEEGQFLRLLIEIMSARKILEIGTFTGYSALCMALSLADNGRLITCDINKECTEIAKKYWELAKLTHKIQLIIDEALITLDKFILNGEVDSFDFIFIDADKKNYIQYYEKAYSLLRVGGVIAIDNVLWGGKVADTSIKDEKTNAIRELNEKIFHDQRVFISMLPIGDGLTLVKKNK